MSMLSRLASGCGLIAPLDGQIQHAKVQFTAEQVHTYGNAVVAAVSASKDSFGYILVEKTDQALQQPSCTVYLLH